jgi:hypothetical protein
LEKEFRLKSSSLRFATVLSGLLIATSAQAQKSPKPAPAPAPAAPAADDKVGQAKVHFERGLQLYDEGAYDGARVEFERAYASSPTYKILYNLGLVQKQQSDYVGALRNFEAYLTEGGSNVPQVRRDELAREIPALKARIGTVTVTTNVPDADVAVDDVPVGKSPLKEPVLVNPGRRKISATKKGRNPATKMVEIAGSDQKSVALDLPDARTLVVVTRTRRVPWVGWIATGALAAGAGVMGYLAISSSSDLKDMRAQPKAQADELESKASQGKTFSIIADLCGVGAVIAGGVSLYLTIKWGKEDTANEERALPGPEKAWLKRTPEAGKASASGGWVRFGPAGPGLGATGAF